MKTTIFDAVCDQDVGFEEEDEAAKGVYTAV